MNVSPIVQAVEELQEEHEALEAVAKQLLEALDEFSNQFRDDEVPEFVYTALANGRDKL
jgi:uncharacterized protein (UPF0147 family)